MEYDDFRSTTFFTSLNGLRALSIIPVIWHHTGIRAYEDNTILSRGWTGVPLFFAISGFLITTLLLRERERTGTIDLRRFYWRRTLRIFPLYYAVLAVYTVLASAGLTDAGDEYLRNLPYFLSYTTNFLDPPPVLMAIGWSLAAEEQFYLTWPWVEKLAPRYSGWIMGALLAVLLPVQFAWFRTFTGGGPIYQLVLTVQIAICGGVVVAHVLHSRKGFAITSPVLGNRWTSTIVLGVVLAILAVPDRGEATLTALQYVGANLALVGVVAASVVDQDHVLGRLLQVRWIARVGVVSYGIYLLHLLVANFIERLPFWPEGRYLSHFFVTVVLTYVAAEISFRTFEAYFLTLKDRHFAAPR